MDDIPRGLSAITGRYSYVPCPCVTTPCLPGMAYAVLANELYYITAGGHWFAENRAWDGYAPGPGELVTVTGHVLQRTDVSGKPFATIEAVRVKRAS